MMSDYIHSHAMNFYCLFINYFVLALSNIKTTMTPLAFSKSCKLLLFSSLVYKRFLQNSSYVRERQGGGRYRGLGKIGRRQAEYLANQAMDSNCIRVSEKSLFIKTTCDIAMAVFHGYCTRRLITIFCSVGYVTGAQK